MAQIKAAFETLEDFNDVASQVIKKFPELFPNVDADDFLKKIRCVGITNKERKEDTTPEPEVKGVVDPIRMFCEVSYVVIAYSKDWVEMDEAHKAVFVLKALRRIPIDDESEGKVVPVDFKDDGVLVRTLGVDYMERTDLPNILKEDVKWSSR